MIFALGIIFLPIRNFISTFLYVLLPFLMTYYYGLSTNDALLTIVLPFVGYPLMALKGYYNDQIY